MGAMRKSTKPRRNRTSRASSTPQTIPLGDASEAANRLALKFDKQVSTATFTAKSLAKLQSEIAGATIRGGSAAPLFDPNKVPPGLSWPNALYVPGDQHSFGLPKPPADHCTVSRGIYRALRRPRAPRRGRCSASRGRKRLSAARLGSGRRHSFSPHRIP